MCERAKVGWSTVKGKTEGFVKKTKPNPEGITIGTYLIAELKTNKYFQFLLDHIPSVFVLMVET